ncbi:uncharacterized protein FFB20_03209 [Fusarium fujikuroi]|uniref:Apple domain-containing protein n=2 Tax=Fusarium fujikuroi TaxID=5127 RepID=S0DSB2_GIBF5|nr:uncharacterized protein FFUJ_02390 [Fusarium fujikuroi IMI 58289]QGI61601.1 hypothetical protein CEK27_005572 [Fusarium fujikuroi]QGI78788.1 hypothetical protein CEK25_005517 [Fusarium fujikuroi]CCT65449.1 uncharacterized protein FFUJ_02390 [Fusarium fujikuroi IMI 58289]SCN68753.1 uncharacterized protein FFB20_03209 [Fusarium fujikuroi]SCO17423.1 uncharacterized protein FFE2_13842 [Fusarium fujikuroi]
MPSSKVFAAILAALAVADASPCKPKPVTTSGSTAAVVTTSGSTDILSSTATTETAATTTTEAACSHYTPYTEIVPADCGKTGVAPNCADKVIGSPITVTDYAQCGNTCGMTVGCKSFSIKGSSCTLYNAPVSSLGYTFSEGSDASHFYDLDLCFGCGEGTTTSGTETATGSQTTGTETGTSATGSATETTGTASAGTTTATVSETETSATGSETGTTTATGFETETSGTAHATGTTDTETSATGSQTETTTAPGATTETSATETLTANTDTTTAAATTTTSAGCTAYTQVANPPYNNCNVRGSASGGASMSQLATYGNTASVNDCALKCANYHDATKPNDKCLSFALDGSNTCYVYSVPVSTLGINRSGLPAWEFNDLEACYSCDEGAATTTTTAAGVDTTTTAETGSETGTTTEAAGSTTTTEAGSDTTTTTAAVESSTTEAATTTTSAGCTAYTPVANPPAASCDVRGAPNGFAAFMAQLIGIPDSNTEECARQCGMYVSSTIVDDKCLSFGLDASNTCYLYKVQLSSLSVDAAGTPALDFHDFAACYSCDEGGATTTTTTTESGTTTTEESGSSTTEAIVGSTTTEAGSGTTTTTAAGVDTTATTTTEAGAESSTTEAASTTDSVCTGYTPVPNPPSTNCAVKGKTYKTYISTDTGSSADVCASKCSEVSGCKTFAYKASSSTCTFYTQTVSELQINNCASAEESEFYEFEICYAGCGQATTTTEAAGSTTTTEAGIETTATTTTEAGEGSTTTTEAAVASTTTTEAGEASTTTTEAGAASTTTEAAVAPTTTTEAGSTTEAPTTTTTEAQSTTEAPTTTTEAPVCTNYIPLSNAPSTCGKQGKVSCRSTQKLGQATSVTDVNACGKLCGTTLTCKTFSYTPKFRSTGGYCQLYSAPLAQLSFTPCNTGVKFYDLDTCYTCSNTPTPTPPATCSKYVPAFEKCAKDTHCGTRGEICQEEKINAVGDASCLENCAKSCINYGKECKYFSYQPAFYNSAAKCTLYKSGKINKKSTSWVKFYEQDCFKCQQSK